MAKRYDLVSEDVMRRLQSVRDSYHGHLAPFTVSALFISNADGEACLTHSGYPAAALCRIVPGRDRAAGLSDAQIVIDRAIWQTLTVEQQTALLDHELTHIERVLDNDGALKYDAQDRPKCRMRKHDHQHGWFDEVASRHGMDSMEVRQARLLIDQVGQLYFDFAGDKAA